MTHFCFEGVPMAGPAHWVSQHIATLLVPLLRSNPKRKQAERSTTVHIPLDGWWYYLVPLAEQPWFHQFLGQRGSANCWVNSMLRPFFCWQFKIRSQPKVSVHLWLNFPGAVKRVAWLEWQHQWTTALSSTLKCQAIRSLDDNPVLLNGYTVWIQKSNMLPSSVHAQGFFLSGWRDHLAAFFLLTLQCCFLQRCFGLGIIASPHNPLSAAITKFHFAHQTCQCGSYIGFIWRGF